MEIPKSTVRFAQVVQESGRPEPVTLWTDPQKDSGFQAVMRQNRVMTLIQETVGSHKDLAIVGFHRVEHASYLVFPKSLGRFEGKRIIGIKYDLLEVPKTSVPGEPTPKPARQTSPRHEDKRFRRQTKKPPPQPKPEPPKPDLARYRVTIRYTAVLDVEREVQAETAQRARELALSKEIKDAMSFPAEGISQKVLRQRRD